jgi:hypothetical protein
VFDETSDWDMTLQIIGIFAACSWLVCAVIYTVATFVEWRTQSGGIEGTENMDEYDERAGESAYDVVKLRRDDHPSFTTSSLESWPDPVYEGQSKSWNSVSRNFYEKEVEC